MSRSRGRYYDRHKCSQKKSHAMHLGLEENVRPNLAKCRLQSERLAGNTSASTTSIVSAPIMFIRSSLRSGRIWLAATLDARGALAVIATLTSLAAMAAAGPAEAHMGTGLPGGFASGFFHPLTGFDHMLAMVSVGLWGAFLGRPLIVALPVIFPTVMAFGAFLGIANVPFPPVEIGIGLSVLILGCAIAAAWRAPVWAACLIVAIFGLFHGYAHGKELPSAADPIGFAVGFVLSTGLLHVAGIGIGLLNDRPGGIMVTRTLGGLVGAAGLYFLVTAIFK